MARTFPRSPILTCGWLVTLVLVSGALASDPPKKLGPQDGVIPPRILLKTQVAPVFPPAAQAARFSGIVTIAVRIDTSGAVERAHTVESTHPNVGFEEAALEAVRKWRFEPATLNGDPVPYETTYRLTFDRRGTGVINSASMSSGPPSDLSSGGRWQSLDNDRMRLDTGNRTMSRNPGGTRSPNTPSRR